ncbi:MAG: SIMPL domain-containing protein [Acidobacteria bacterium]|nr:SIMPL domain-containing protein [Acidobacteriota bacterium]
MKAIITSSLLLFALTISLFGQQIVEAIRGIEVSGTAERMVEPDELTFRIGLAERMGTRGKITIEQQEAQLRSELQKIGIDTDKDLSIYDLTSRYVRLRRGRDVMARQNYRLVIRDLEKVAPLQDLADRINVEELYLVLAENSKIEEIRRELRIEAIRDARAKAEYMMQAIGGRIGKAIFVKEIAEDSPYDTQVYYGASNAAYSAANVAARSVVMPLSFAPEKVKIVVLARFEIQ